MARYRKIDVRIWNDKKFRALSDDGKLGFFFLLTHPHMTSIGAMRATVPGLASEIGWDGDRFPKAFGEATSKGMAKHDADASMIWLPNFIHYNVPENPNVLKAWAGAIDLLPECELRDEAVQSVKAFAEGLSEAFAEAYAKAFPEGARKGIGKQEQEQEPEQEQEQGKAGASPSGAAGFALDGTNKKVKIANGTAISMKTFFERCTTLGVKPVPEDDAVFGYATKAGIPHDFIALAWRVFCAKYKTNAKRQKDWRQTFRNYVEQAGYGLWTVEPGSNQYALTGKGRQAMKAYKPK